MHYLEGSCFRLRPFTMGDAASLQKNINDEKVYETMFSIPYPYTEKDADEFIAVCSENNNVENPSQVQLAITRDNVIIGGIGLKDMRDGEAELGYWLVPRLWNKGIMAEAVGMVLWMAKTFLGIQKIKARPFPSNAASIKILEKYGFAKTGDTTTCNATNGRTIESEWYMLEA